MNEVVIDDSQREMCAVLVMRTLKQPESYLISEEEMLRRLGITEADLVGFEDVEIE